MKFLLLTTTKKDFVKVWLCQQTSAVGSLVPPVDLVSVGSVLKENGHTVKISDLRLEQKPLIAYRQIIIKFKPDAIILNLTTPSAITDYELLNKAPQKIYKIVFGSHASTFPNEAFKEGIDFILWGDPEKAILNLIKSEFNKKGTVGVLTINKPKNKPALFKNLDELPFSNLDLLDISKYSVPYFPRGRRFTFLLSSRGCPFGCTFCLAPYLFGSRYRGQSIKRMVDELEYLQTRFGIREVFYLDPTFNISIKKVQDFCWEISKRKLNISWSVNMRATPTPLKMLKLMKRTGCRRLMYGVEDFDLLEGIQKKLTKREILTAFAKSQKAGLKADAYTLIFPQTPWNEKEYVDHILKMLKEIKPDGFQCNVAMPLPGSPLFEKKRSQEKLSNDWSLYDPGIDHKLPYKSEVDLFKVRRKVYLLYPFIQPRKVIDILLTTDLKSIKALVKKYIFHLGHLFFNGFN